MTKKTFDLLVKRAEKDHNTRVLVDRIRKGLPMQGGKPIKVEME